MDVAWDLALALALAPLFALVPVPVLLSMVALGLLFVVAVDLLFVVPVDLLFVVGPDLLFVADPDPALLFVAVAHPHPVVVHPLLVVARSVLARRPDADSLAHLLAAVAS